MFSPTPPNPRLFILSDTPNLLFCTRATEALYRCECRSGCDLRPFVLVLFIWSRLLAWRWMRCDFCKTRASTRTLVVLWISHCPTLLPLLSSTGGILLPKRNVLLASVGIFYLFTCLACCCSFFHLLSVLSFAKLYHIISPAFFSTWVGDSWVLDGETSIDGLDNERLCRGWFSRRESTGRCGQEEGGRRRLFALKGRRCWIMKSELRRWKDLSASILRCSDSLSG